MKVILVFVQKGPRFPNRVPNFGRLVGASSTNLAVIKKNHCSNGAAYEGLIPTGSGLSSSADFACSSTIAIMAALNVNLPKKEVAQLTCECERHVWDKICWNGAVSLTRITF
ncbi:hypothetical protein L1887_27728 [Cichorium endivia]|nr:hypothetical protein L1887_27728 [Cichorium endivia]